MSDSDVAAVETAPENTPANPFANPPATPAVTARTTPPQSSWSDVFDKHPLIATCVAILLFPVVLAVATVAGARWLFARGHRNLAIVVIVAGSAAALGGAYWYVSASNDSTPSRPDRTQDEVEEPNFLGEGSYDKCRDAGYGRLDCTFGHKD